jgi:two-component system, LuxR family, sensor kinase FixL
MKNPQCGNPLPKLTFTRHVPPGVTAVVLMRLASVPDAWYGRLGGRDVLGRVDYRHPRYWVAGALFIAAYIAIERATLVYQLDGLGITLWGPTAGLSVAFLMACGLSFVPFVFLASLLSDYVVYLGPRGLVAPIGTSLVLMLGFGAIALVLRESTSLSLRPKVRDALNFLLVVPTATAIIAALYCSVLFASGLLSSWRFVIAMRNFWIGETLGIVTILPATGILLATKPNKLLPFLRANLSSALGLAAGVSAALLLVFGVREANEYQFFYLLFLPIIWAAVRRGYASVTLTLLCSHVLLVTLATKMGYAAYDFMAFQMLMLVLSATGLILGAAIAEGRCAEERLRVQQLDLARAARHAIVGATGTAIAHEISQPLSSATTYLHAARRLFRSNVQDLTSIAAALDSAAREAQRARETLERVRDYVSSGQLQLTDVDVERSARKVVDLVNRDAKAQGIFIHVHCGKHLPSIFCDRVQIEQILLNLVANAVDAAGSTRDGTKVAVQVSQRGDRVRIRVEDDGPGIGPEMASRLFEPFETSKSKGMGLGLTLVRQIVEAHTGEIRWGSIEPHGAWFSVELPVDGPRQ